MSEVVNSLEEAKAGDSVWLFNSQQSRYDENRVYLGRGVWTIKPIESETKQSFVVDRIKFDRKDGTERVRGGYSSANRIYGEAEREKSSWLAASYSISELVKKSKDVDILKAVAAIFDYELPTA